jgi:hypothetical protein
LSEDPFKGTTMTSAWIRAEFHAERMEYRGDIHAYIVPTLEKVSATPFCTKKSDFRGTCAPRKSSRHPLTYAARLIGSATRKTPGRPRRTI